MENFINYLEYRKVFFSLNKKTLKEKKKFLNKNINKYKQNTYLKPILSLFDLINDKKIIYFNDDFIALPHYNYCINFDLYISCVFNETFDKITIYSKNKDKFQIDSIKIKNNLKFENTNTFKKKFRSVPILKWSKEIALHSNNLYFHKSALNKKILLNLKFKKIYSKNLLILKKIDSIFKFFKKGIKFSKEDSYQGGLVNDAFLMNKNNILYSPNYVPSKFFSYNDLTKSNKNFYNSKWKLLFNEAQNRKISKSNFPMIKKKFEEIIYDINKINNVNKINDSAVKSFQTFVKKLNNKNINQFSYNKKSRNIYWVLFLHTFSDAALAFGDIECGTVYNYFQTVFKQVSTSFPNDKILIKMHPSVFGDTKLLSEAEKADASMDITLFKTLLEDLAKNYKIELIDPSIRIPQLSKMNFIGITHHGTVCLEGSYLNAPIFFTKYAGFSNFLDKRLLISKNNLKAKFKKIRKLVIKKNYNFNNNKKIISYWNGISTNFKNKSLTHTKDYKTYWNIRNDNEKKIL